ncbi:MAG: P-II family nitrogen regulator [Lachnospiraceae bacterium]|nr:P-II family nitrogen regulator [Lachnospiraceae bacterium]
MELYLTIAILDRPKAERYQVICSELGLAMRLTLLGRGTATEAALDRYGLRATDKAVVLTTALPETNHQLFKLCKRRLMIDIPGNGIMMCVPIKSVGSMNTLAYLSNNAAADKGVPEMNFKHELIIVILNQTYGDMVMKAARSAGATGGTVLHAKGTGADYARQFLGVQLATEKEVIMITAKSEIKQAIMTAITEQAGPHTKAGAISFSLPVSHVAGLRVLDDDEEEMMHKSNEKSEEKTESSAEVK